MRLSGAVVHCINHMHMIYASRCLNWQQTSVHVNRSSGKVKDMGQQVESVVQSAMRQAYKREQYSGAHVPSILSRQHGTSLFCIRIDLRVSKCGHACCADEDRAAHLFLQRVLYKINRMVLFWYDDLRNYTNERSIWLANLRDRIEEQWQAWELEQLDQAARISRDMPLEQVSLLLVPRSCILVHCVPRLLCCRRMAVGLGQGSLAYAAGSVLGIPAVAIH